MALTFWYEFSSTYSFLAAMRIDVMAERAGVSVIWQPLLLGPLFKDAGYRGSPNLASPAKAQYMWDDLARRSAHRGHGFTKPQTFPQHTVKAARAAIALEPAGRAAFSRALFAEIFINGGDAADPATIGEAADRAGLDAQEVMAAADSPEAKQALFSAVDEARALGIFGAPTFVTSDGALFWGDDRLEDALAWQTTGRLAG